MRNLPIKKAWLTFNINVLHLDFMIRGGLKWEKEKPPKKKKDKKEKEKQ